MKSKVGIIKEVDKLGRIVIPKEFRERYGLQEGVEIVATEFGIVLRNPEYKLVKADKEETVDRCYPQKGKGGKSENCKASRITSLKILNLL